MDIKKEPFKEKLIKNEFQTKKTNQKNLKNLCTMVFLLRLLFKLNI